MGNGKNHHAMIVPLSAIVSDENGSTYVWRYDPDTERVDRIPVSTGNLTDGGLEIVSGLDPDAQILAAGVDFVVEGQKVRPISADQTQGAQD